MRPIDPELARLVADRQAGPNAEIPPFPSPAPSGGQSREEWLAEVATCRARWDALAAAGSSTAGRTGPDVGSVRDHPIPVEGAAITARAYTPVGSGPFPAIVSYHGGAFWMAGGEVGFALAEAPCRDLCAGLGSVVVHVDYRLAPEHPYPVQLEDNYTALTWVVDHAAELDVDPANLSVMGASSGANQAAAVCLLARNRGGPTLRGQILLAPTLDFTGSSPSIAQEPMAALVKAVVAPLYAPPDRWTDPLVSPLLAEDLSGLPPAVIVTGAHDPLRDDGRRYAQRLGGAGVDVWWREYPMLHDVALPETYSQLTGDLVTAVGTIQAGGRLVPS
jgi:acetyl esterase